MQNHVRRWGVYSHHSLKKSTDREGEVANPVTPGLAKVYQKAEQSKDGKYRPRARGWSDDKQAETAK